MNLIWDSKAKHGVYPLSLHRGGCSLMTPLENRVIRLLAKFEERRGFMSDQDVTSGWSNEKGDSTPESGWDKERGDSTPSSGWDNESGDSTPSSGW